jgi:hypothetical protein
VSPLIRLQRRRASLGAPSLDASPAARRLGGFTLVELLLAFALGMGLCGAMLQLLLLQGRQGDLLVRQLREQGFQRRALELLRGDLQRAEGVRLGQVGAAPCPLGGREPLLEIQTPEGSVLYSLGPPPSPIWRGWVLMRCGGAFGLDGEPSTGAAQNRVVLDGLAAGAVHTEPRGVDWLRLELRQEFPLAGGGRQRVRSGLEVSAPLLP